MGGARKITLQKMWIQGWEEFANYHRCQIPKRDLWIQCKRDKNLMCVIVDLDERTHSIRYQDIQ